MLNQHVGTSRVLKKNIRYYSYLVLFLPAIWLHHACAFFIPIGQKITSRNKPDTINSFLSMGYVNYWLVNLVDFMVKNWNFSVK